MASSSKPKELKNGSSYSMQTTEKFLHITNNGDIESTLSILKQEEENELHVNETEQKHIKNIEFLSRTSLIPIWPLAIPVLFNTDNTADQTKFHYIKYPKYVSRYKLWRNSCLT
ncbi:hypothetical protein BLOT_010173 [Blomia tropicalis]|nr:hypothetical protein BLOT_010173 [Blomia tropicalis]